MKKHLTIQNAALVCGFVAVLTGIVLQASSGIEHPSHSLERNWNLQGAVPDESSQEQHKGFFAAFSRSGCRAFSSIYSVALQKFSMVALFASEGSAPSIPLLFPVPSKVNHALD